MSDSSRSAMTLMPSVRFFSSLRSVGGTRAERLPPAIMPAKCSRRSMGLRMRRAMRRPMRAERRSAPSRISASSAAEKSTTRVIWRLLWAERLIWAEM